MPSPLRIDASVDAVVMDPPYYDNVMYAELADFFYVWLKRTAGLLFPEQFSSYLTDKDREAVANPAKFKGFTQVKGSGGAQKRAHRDYQERMQAIFAECRRVLKPEGMMVLMFTHKATGAWDALSRGLIDAGFKITASWPVNTEAEGSLHIKDKSAAKSTIFLVCRPRQAPADPSAVTYWEEVEPEVARVVRERVETFQTNGIRGVDLYLACFGPALEVFSNRWPMQRGRALQKPEPVKGAQFQLEEDEDWDPYAVRPEDALMAARAAVKEWRLDQLTTVKRHVHLDPATEFYALAWDAYQSPQFPADEALKLARVVGVNFDGVLRNRILEVKGGDVILWDSATRMKRGALGSPKGDLMLDVLHHAARLVREQNTGAAKDLLDKAGLLDSPELKTALETVLNVLPAPALATSGSGPLAGAAADADALEKLRKLAFAEDVPPPRRPEQMELDTRLVQPDLPMDEG
jgi:putative DNA methylase